MQGPWGPQQPQLIHLSCKVTQPHKRLIAFFVFNFNALFSQFYSCTVKSIFPLKVPRYVVTLAGDMIKCGGYFAAGCSTHVDLTEDCREHFVWKSTLWLFVCLSYKTLPGKVIQLFIDGKGIDCENNTSHKLCLITGLLTMSSSVRRAQGHSGPPSEHVRGRQRYNVTADESICLVKMHPNKHFVRRKLAGGDFCSAEEPQV